MANKPQLDPNYRQCNRIRVADASECAAILDSKIGDPWVQSIKSFTGHTMAAAGVYNIIAGLIQQEHKFFSHTLHLEENLTHIVTLNHISHGGIRERVNYMLSNTMGLGSNNACMIIEFR